jgi:predicted RNase H-like HicB family nuclease
MNEQLFEKAINLASQNYPVKVSKDKTTTGEVIFLAKNPGLPGCMAQGNTIEEALENLMDARIDYIHSLLEDELEVPRPDLVETTTSLTSDSYTSVGTSAFQVKRIAEPKIKIEIEDDMVYEAAFRS